MKNLIKPFSLLVLLSASLFFASCEKDSTSDAMPSLTITEVASSNPDFSSLVLALKKTGLDAALMNKASNFTVFAPTNAAFASLLTELKVGSLNDIPAETLTKVLLYHVKSGKATASQITSGYYASLANGPVAGSYLSLYADMTSKTINSRSKISLTDITADNGVIHVIDKVLLPPSIVDLAQQNSMFSTLVQALVKADLAGTLSGAGPFTVFAPTNDAFAALFSALKVSGIDALTKEQLTPILLAHVVSGNIQSGSLISGGVATLNTQKSLNIVVGGNGVTINGNINVIKADVQGQNGVVHVIDKVIVP